MKTFGYDRPAKLVPGPKVFGIETVWGTFADIPRPNGTWKVNDHEFDFGKDFESFCQKDDKGPLVIQRDKSFNNGTLDRDNIQATLPPLPDQKRELKLSCTCGAIEGHSHATSEEAQACIDRHTKLPATNWHSALVDICSKVVTGSYVIVASEDQVRPVREVCERLRRKDLVVRVA